MLATAPVRSHDPSDRGAQGLAIEAPAARPSTAGGRAVGRLLGGELSYPLGILAVFAFVSSLCAVMAVLPRVSGVLPPGVRRNMMFFGHFHDLDEEEWTLGVLAELHADEGVFRLMLHDIYQNGQVLQHRKYRYLGYAYRLFVAGLVVTLAVFAVEFALAYA